MKTTRKLFSVLAFSLLASSVMAAVSPEEAAKLGTSLTPLGAEKAGNADGTIPEWTGGLKTDAAPLKNGHLTNPFKDEQPKFVITAQNAEVSAGQLGGAPAAPGQQLNATIIAQTRLQTPEEFSRILIRVNTDGSQIRLADVARVEVALDIALQCSPDHPWVQEHPEWFVVRADGTIAYAENPPKKYQDIYPINFDNAPEKLYAEIYRVVMYWVNLGITTFRVDNPHTKPVNFWHWLITKVHETDPDVIFLAEAFTRPPRMYGLSKAGFSQSYTHFTWKTTKDELTDFAQLLVDVADVSRPNLFVNTPDILHESLQKGGPAMFAIRATLAATMSPLWGVYSGYELYEHEPVAEGSEEYLDSEKYELRPRDFEAALARGESLEPYLTMLNRIRRENPALQQLRNIVFHDISNDNLLAYSKVDAVTGNAVLVVVNLDPYFTQEATLRLNLGELGLNPGEPFEVADQITGARYTWGAEPGGAAYIRLAPQQNVAHIFRLPDVAPERREPLAYRRISDHDYRP